MMRPFVLTEESVLSLVLMLLVAMSTAIFFNPSYLSLFTVVVFLTSFRFGVIAGFMATIGFVVVRLYVFALNNYVFGQSEFSFRYFSEVILFAGFAILVGYLFSKWKSRESEIRHMAFHDPLTGLANRMLLEEKTKLVLQCSKRRGTKFAVILIDLDNFKKINDDFGHLAGDFLLKTMARRIESCVREEDVAARIGGDEFVVLLTEIGNKEDSWNVAGKIVDCLRQPIFIKGHRFIIESSVGISVYPNDGRILKTLFSKADEALYRVKSRGGGNLAFAKK